MKKSHPMLVPQVHVAMILQRNRCLTTAYVVVVLPRKMEENPAVKHQTVIRAGVSATTQQLVAPIDVNVLIVEILMAAPGCQKGIHTSDFKVPTQAKTTRGQREQLQSGLPYETRVNSSIWMV